MQNTGLERRFSSMWADLAPVGRCDGGGYTRLGWTTEDGLLREWFTGEAHRRGLDLMVDRAGNQWAWWGDPDAAATAGDPGVAAGSHLDSVLSGGAFDGPLGVVGAFAAVDMLRAAGHSPTRPIGVVNFGNEEGARFGVACGGSRVLTGQLAPDTALGLRDNDGVSQVEAMRRIGVDLHGFGRDDETLRRVGVFVELHIEQGRDLVGSEGCAGQPVGVGSGIWPHGRFRFDLDGEANHAGTTRLEDRNDAMVRLAKVVTAAREIASEHGALATVGKVAVEPNGVNSIASSCTHGWTLVHHPSARSATWSRKSSVRPVPEASRNHGPPA